jgi:ketosteroid isomerase-like protein
MRTMRFRGMEIALLALGMSGGCTAPPREAAASQADAAAEVRRAIDAFYDAARRSDWAAAGELMADDFEVYSDGPVALGKAAYVQDLRSADLRLDSMELRDLRIRVARGGDMAWASWRGWFRTVTAGVPSEAETAETQVFRSEGGRWLLVRAHASIRELPGA